MSKNRGRFYAILAIVFVLFSVIAFAVLFPPALSAINSIILRSGLVLPLLSWQYFCKSMHGRKPLILKAMM